MKTALALILALLIAAPAFGQDSVGIIIGPIDTNGNLRDIAGLADPNASRVLKWNDSTNVIEWATDATGGGGGSGDVDAFAADPTANTNFAPSIWRAELGLTLDADVQRYDPDLAALSGGYNGIIKGLDDDNGFAVATLGADYINNGSIDTSAEIASIVSNETGTGSLVFATSPTLTTPNLGTPSAITLTNGTGLPISTGVSGLGAGIATMLGTPSSANVAAAVTNETGSGSLVFATSPAFTTPNLGTPSAATLTNATGLPIATGVSGLGTGVATVLATPTSANLATAITNETGSGALVFGTSPTIGGTAAMNNVTIGGTLNLDGDDVTIAEPDTGYQVPAPITIYKTDGTQITRGVGLSGDALGDALESAIASDLLTGYRMKLGPGNFTGISDDLLLPSNVTIEGSGPATLVKLEGSRTDAVVAIFSNADTSSGNSDIRIANMTLDMNNTQNTDTSKKQSGVMFTKVDRFIVEGLVCQNAGRLLTDTCVGIHLIGCTDGQVINNKCTNVVDGINTQASTDFCRRLYIGGNVIESTNRDYGLTMFQIYDSVIANNVISGAFKQGIEISYSSNNVFANNFVKNCGKQTNVTYPGINISSVGAPANNLLIGNQVRNGSSGNLQSYGIVVNSSSANNVLIGNDFTDGGDTGAMSILSSSCVQLGNVTGNATLDAQASRTALGATAGVWAGSLVAAATTSAQGASELATSAETTTGSDTTRTITPDAYRGSDFGKRFGQFVCVGSATTLTTGDGKGEVFYRVPSELNGWNLVGVAAAVDTVSSSGTPTFQVRRRRLTSATATSDADMLSTAITIDASEFDSKDAATAAVINTSNDDVNTGDRIFADCDTAGTGTKGMSITLVFQKP